LHRPLLLLWLVLLLFVTGLPLYADSPTTHTVAWGETLYSIARVYGVTPQALANANRQSINGWVYAGQRLVVPGGVATQATSATPSGYYAVRAGDTLATIGARFGTSAAAIAMANNLPPAGLVYVGWTLRIPATSGGSARSSTALTYIVQPDEYLYQIAFRYGTTRQAIMVANSLSNDWQVYAGQRLTILADPTNSGSPSAPAVVNTNVRLSGIPLFRQQQTLTCEEASVAMATRGAVSEARLLTAMPRSDNPFFGIRGRTNSPYLGGLTDYGAYAQAIQKGLLALGVKSTVLYGQAYDDFKSAILDHLRAGRPVVWWTTWHEIYQSVVAVKTSDGATVGLVPYEHAGVIVGADDRGVTYHDPYDATVRFVSWADHRRVSGYLHNMALVIQ
jgi:LysM repeat protein/uncharacterized protein YvpB